MERTKACTKCNLELPLEQFSKNTITKDGLRHTCKGCDREYRRTYKEKSALDKKCTGRPSKRIGAPPKQTSRPHKYTNECLYVIKIGRRKGTTCGQPSLGKYCRNHKPERVEYFKQRRLAQQITIEVEPVAEPICTVEELESLFGW